MADIYANTQVKLSGTFRSVTGSLTDPTDVTLTVRSPGGTSTTYTYSLAQVTKESVGVYSKTVTFDQEGEWVYKFQGTGALIVAGAGKVIVAQDRLP